MILKYIQPSDIKQYWSQIKPSLNDMANKSENWIVEDAYADLITGTAHLYLTIKDNVFVGYVILQNISNNIHIWAAYGESDNILQEGLNEIIKLAKQNKFKEITFTSNRKGWNKVAPKLGFEPKTWVYKC